MTLMRSKATVRQAVTVLEQQLRAHVLHTNRREKRPNKQTSSHTPRDTPPNSS